MWSNAPVGSAGCCEPGPRRQVAIALAEGIMDVQQKTKAGVGTGVETSLSFAVVIIGVALIFDMANGWHDCANSIATVVATRVLSPTQAVIWAAVFNFVAAFVFGTKVAGTISGDMVDNKL